MIIYFQINAVLIQIKSELPVCSFFYNWTCWLRASSPPPLSPYITFRYVLKYHLPLKFITYLMYDPLVCITISSMLLCQENFQRPFSGLLGICIHISFVADPNVIQQILLVTKISQIAATNRPPNSLSVVMALRSSGRRWNAVKYRSVTVAAPSHERYHKQATMTWDLVIDCAGE